jgi:hypothetical protein
LLVGADGKTGFTRKNYLEPLGIRMEQAHQYGYPVPTTVYNTSLLIIRCIVHIEHSTTKHG